MSHQPIERLVDLTVPSSNVLVGMSLDEARERVRSGSAESVLEINGSFAIVAQSGKIVRMARSLDRPLRYFLAKAVDGPVLVVADRIDTIAEWLRANGKAEQFHPSYTRMVPAHHVLTLHLVGCPDPEPTLLRFFNPQRGTLPADLDEIGRQYIGALASEVQQCLEAIPAEEPIGVSFSGGIDSGAVFVTLHEVLRRRGESPARLKCFTLDLDGGPDLQQAREFLQRLDMEMFLEPIEADPAALDLDEVIATIEDYKPLDVESAAMAMLLARGIRERYPDWRILFDGEGGDENLKDYPLEEGAEVTIRSVLSNSMLYQEGWGVHAVKHSHTYSGGQSRGVVRTFAPLSRHCFTGFSPYTRPRVIEVAEAIPFVELTDWDVDKLYALKGEIASRGVRAHFGVDMPIFPKRRFQHGAVPESRLRELLPGRELDYRQRFAALHA